MAPITNMNEKIWDIEKMFHEEFSLLYKLAREAWEDTEEFKNDEIDICDPYMDWVWLYIRDNFLGVYPDCEYIKKEIREYVKSWIE